MCIVITKYTRSLQEQPKLGRLVDVAMRIVIINIQQDRQMMRIMRAGVIISGGHEAQCSKIKHDTHERSLESRLSGASRHRSSQPRASVDIGSSSSHTQYFISPAPSFSLLFIAHLKISCSPAEFISTILWKLKSAYTNRRMNFQ